jgi:lysophospholipase L1-like esterase
MPSRRVRLSAMQIRRAVACTLLALLVAGPFAMACSNKGDSVAVIGDSITALDQSAMNEQLGGTYELVVTGNFGKTVAEVMPEAKVLAQRSYDQVIINLGTNDVLQALPVDTSMAALREMIGLFDSASCIHLVDINEHMVVQGTGISRTAEAERFNAALEDLVSSDPRVSVVDWNEVAAGALNDQEPPFSSLTQDSIHPTADGNTELNQLYATALGGCRGPL